MSFMDTMSGFLGNLGLGSPWMRLAVGFIGAIGFMYVVKPSVAFNPDGTQKQFFMLATNPKAPSTVFHPLLVALLFALFFFLFI